MYKNIDIIINIEKMPIIKFIYKKILKNNVIILKY